jgi:hypothetical protein
MASPAPARYYSTELEPEEHCQIELNTRIMVIIYGLHTVPVNYKCIYVKNIYSYIDI